MYSFLFSTEEFSGWNILKKLQFTQFGLVSVLSPYEPEVMGVLYNPAMLGNLNYSYVYLVSEVGVLDDKFGGLFYGEKTGRVLAMLGVVYYYGGIAELYWIENDVLKKREVTAQKDILYVVSYEYDVYENLFFGVNLKAANSVLAEEYSAYSYVADVGMVYSPLKNFYFSYSFKNLGVANKFLQEQDCLPILGHFGCGVLFGEEKLYFLSSLGVDYFYYENKFVPQVGVEFKYKTLSFNCGYKFDVSDFDFLVGVRFVKNNVILGYGFVPSKYFGFSHRLSFTYRFGVVKRYLNNF